MARGSAVQFPFRLIDLTHPVTEGMPVWPGDPATEKEWVARHESDGWMLNAWTLSEHAGTHIGAPSHFIKDRFSIERIPPTKLIWPAVVVDVRQTVLPRGEVTIDFIRGQEVEWGQMTPPGAIILLRTGWDKRWPNPDLVFELDKDENFFWPGFTHETAAWLIEDRKAAALGTDTPGIDPGADTQFEAGHFCAACELPHLENLAHLDQMPTLGAWLLAAPLPLEEGSGSPVRALGLIPH